MKDAGGKIRTIIQEIWRNKAQYMPDRGWACTAGARLEAVITTAAMDEAAKITASPTTHIAKAVRQERCWEMTYLPAVVVGRWFHLHLILDLYSRKIVGWEVNETDESRHAAHLVKRAALAEGLALMETKPVLHGDNGSTLKATTVPAMLHWLGVKPSYSRPA